MEQRQRLQVRARDDVGHWEYTTYQLKAVLEKGGSQTNMGTFSTAVAAAIAYWRFKNEDVKPVSDVEHAKTSGCGKRKR